MAVKSFVSLVPGQLSSWVEVPGKLKKLLLLGGFTESSSLPLGTAKCWHCHIIFSTAWLYNTSIGSTDNAFGNYSKRLLVTIRSSLLLKIIYKYMKQIFTKGRNKKVIKSF